MLEIRNLHAGYGQIEILRGINLDVGASEIVAVLGSNGVGKSTLNNTVSGLVPAWRGRVRLPCSAAVAAAPRAQYPCYRGDLPSYHLL